MAYNVFTMKRDGHYDGVLQRAFAHDEDAIAFARELLSTHPAIEVWDGGRCVIRVGREEVEICAENQVMGGAPI
jgi:hypothetical protein